jgi:hypothetical protein
LTPTQAAAVVVANPMANAAEAARFVTIFIILGSFKPFKEQTHHHDEPLSLAPVMGSLALRNRAFPKTKLS